MLGVALLSVRDTEHIEKTGSYLEERRCGFYAFCPDGSSRNTAVIMPYRPPRQARPSVGPCPPGSCLPRERSGGHVNILCPASYFRPAALASLSSSKNTLSPFFGSLQRDHSRSTPARGQASSELCTPLGTGHSSHSI